MLCFMSDCTYTRQHNFCTDTPYINYLLHVSALRPSSEEVQPTVNDDGRKVET
jgi:hypothetical protein